MRRPSSPRNRPPARAVLRKAGFTLIEVLVTLAISTAIVLLVTRVWQSVNQAGVILSSQGADWNAERFLRKQLLLALTEPNATRLFEGSDDELMFVTRMSAAGGGEFGLAADRFQDHQADLVPGRGLDVVPEDGEAVAPLQLPQRRGIPRREG